MVHHARKKKRSYFIPLTFLFIGIALAVGCAARLPEEPTDQIIENTVSKPASRLITVPYIPQMPEFPTGCEVVSAVMALQYHGENISVADFVDHYLECSNNFYTAEDGTLCGPDPYQVFVGDPRLQSSYGCFAPVIENAVKKYFGAPDRIQNTTGKSLQQLCEAYIDRGIPVLVWASMEMKETYPSQQWRLESGESFTWIAREHCLVLVGYDEESYFFNDPQAGEAIGYDKQIVEKRYQELGRQSLVITESCGESRNLSDIGSMIQ